MHEKEKYRRIYNDQDAGGRQTDIIPGKMGGGYGRICWGENMLETLKQWKVPSLLDVGCGYGNFCDAAALFVPCVYGLDIASVATGNIIDNPDVTYIDGEAKNLPLPQNAVEWITSFDCLEHCLEQDIDVILEEFNRVASKGFVLSISFEPCEVNGMPLHMTVKPETWWINKLKRYGTVSKEERVPITGTPYLICRKPVQKTLVSYCAGNLGTRLRSLGHADALARQTGRKLLLFWLKNDPLCRINFSGLFSNPIPEIDEAAFLECSFLKIYALVKDVANQAIVSGGMVLRESVKKWGCQEPQLLSEDDTEDSIVIYAPRYGQNMPIGDHGRLIPKLLPVVPSRHCIQDFKSQRDIGKNVMGVHARGTDFGISVDAYAHQMEKALGRNPRQKFLVCSDQQHYEEILLKRFPDNVIVRPKSAWLEKIDHKKPWAHGNISTSEAAVTEALTDLYLLSHTDFKIYHELSAYAQVGAILSNHQRGTL